MKSIPGGGVRKYLEKGSKYPEHFLNPPLFNPHTILGVRGFPTIPISLRRKERLREVRDHRWTHRI